MSRTKRALEKLQKILDYLNDHGPAIILDIANYLNENPYSTSRRLHLLRQVGDVTCERIRLSKQGHKNLKMTAARRITTVQEMHLNQANEKKKARSRRKAPRKKSEGAWHTVHYCDENTRPTKGQGGQGAITSRLTGTYLAKSVG